MKEISEKAQKAGIGEDEHHTDSEVSDNSEDIESDNEELQAKKWALIDEEIQAKVSKFYFFNQKSMAELEHEEIPLEKLEALSQDEIPETEQGSAEDHRLASYKSTRKINTQLGKMIEGFGLISKNLGRNLQYLHGYISDLQNEKEGGNQAHKPRFKNLSKVVNNLIDEID